MVSVDHTAPADVVDHLLWREAQAMLDRHTGPDHHNCCVWCGQHWRCAPRRLAERADAAARSPWREAWTLRHDMNSVRAVPGMRVGGDLHEAGRVAGPYGGNRRARHAAANRGYFD